MRVFRVTISIGIGSKLRRLDFRNHIRQHACNGVIYLATGRAVQL
jgi:hypothetical protein